MICLNWEADWLDMLSDIHNEQEEDLTFLEYCDNKGLNPEEELFHERGDMEHGLSIDSQ